MERELTYEVGETVGDEEPAGLDFQDRSSRVHRVQLVEEPAECSDTRPPGASVRAQVRAQSRYGREFPAPRVLARDFERLGVQRRAERDQRRLDAGRQQSALATKEQRTAVVRLVHDDRLGMLPGRDHDFRARRAYTFQAVELTRGTTRGGRPVSGPQKGGSEGLFVRECDGRHPVGVRQHPVDDARRPQRRDLLARHAECYGGATTEDPSDCALSRESVPNGDSFAIQCPLRVWTGE